MQQRHIIKYFIIFCTILKLNFGFQVFFDKSIGDKHDQIIFSDGGSVLRYEIPLFQTRYLTIRINSSDLENGEYKYDRAIGYKFQVKTSEPAVITIEKQNIPDTTNHLYKVIVDDLYIFPHEKSLGHIFNAYPSPELINYNERLTKHSSIDTQWRVDTVSMGLTNLKLTLNVFYDDDTSSEYTVKLEMLVTQPKRVIDTMFYAILPIMVIGISILMGILLDTTVILSIITQPAPVVIGFVAQYGLMPFLAMSIAKIFHYTPLNSLALFVIGCCPGSGASNQWTIIFDGDVNLSAIMSFVSTTASFFMMPLYFYTIGRIYTDELSIQVPFWGLARSLALVVIPYSIGISISYFSPKARSRVERSIKPIMIFLLIFFLTFGLFVNWYLFLMIDLYTALTAPLLPFLGFILGGLIAAAGCRSWVHIKTIAIEAGIQNTGIAFLIIMYSFPQPYATQALIVPMIVAFLTTKPFWVILLIRNQIKKYKKRKQLGNKNNQQDADQLENDQENNINEKMAEDRQAL